MWYYLLGVIGHLSQDSRSSILLSPHESLLRKGKWPSAAEECPGRTTCVPIVGCLGRGAHEVRVFFFFSPLGRSSLRGIPFSFAAFRKNILKGWDTEREGEHGGQCVITRVKGLGPEVLLQAGLPQVGLLISRIYSAPSLHIHCSRLG